MNFKGNGNVDLIVSFAPKKSDGATLRSGVYCSSNINRNVSKTAYDTLRKLVYEREIGAKLNIQKSNFEPNRKHQIARAVAKRDPFPYLRNIKRSAGDGMVHVTHYPLEPDAPIFVKTIFAISYYCVVSKTKFGGTQIACAINANIKRHPNGTYYIDMDSIKPVKWKPNPNMFQKQLEITKEAKVYFRNEIENA